MLGVAKAGAGFVGAAAGPDFHRINRDERRGGLAVTASKCGRQRRKSDRFRFRVTDQFEQRMGGNGAGDIALEDCGHGAAVVFDLSESHGEEGFRCQFQVLAYAGCQGTIMARDLTLNT